MVSGEQRVQDGGLTLWRGDVSVRAWQAGHGGPVQALMGRHEPSPTLAYISFSFWFVFVPVSVSPCLSVLQSGAWLLCLVRVVLMTQWCFIHVSV